MRPNLFSASALLALQLVFAAPAATQTPGPAVTYDVPAGPLAEALSRFAQQSGVAISIDADRVRGLRSPGLAGRYGVDDGFAQLLRGSGYAASRTVSGYVLIPAPLSAAGTGGPQVLPPVEVSAATPNETAWGHVDGYVAARTQTGSKTDTPLIEVPQSISVVTRDRIDAQAAQTVEQALRYTAGVRTETFGIQTRQEAFFIRGFLQSRTSQYRDGLLMPYPGGYSTWMMEPYGLERIEVLRGPSSVLYGQNGPGGLINLVTRRAGGRQREIEITGGSFGRAQGAFDIGDSIDQAGEFSARLTGLARYSRTQTDFVDDDRAYIAPSVTWRPSADTSLTFLSDYQKIRTGSADSFLPAQGTVYATPAGRIPVNRFSGEPAFNNYDSTQYSLGYLFEHRFDQTWSVRQNLRYAHLNSKYDTVYGSGLAPDLVTLYRGAFNDRSKMGTFAVDNQAEARFGTGPLAHTVLMGLSYQRTLTDLTIGFGGAPSINIYNPVYGAPVPTPATVVSNDQVNNQTGLYLQDQIKVADNWVLVLGGRQDWSNTDTKNRLSGTKTRQSDSAFSGRAGLVYVSAIGLAPYVSYAESFLPVSGVSFGGATFRPETGQQYEAGVKYQPRGVDSFITAAVFDLTRQNVTTPDPAHPGFSIQTGEVRSRGIELEGVASLADGLNLIGSYTYNNVKVTKSNDVDQGKRPMGVPTHMASAWADYTQGRGPLKGLGLGAGVRYVGATPGDLANTFDVPSATLFDASIHYDLGGLSQTLQGVRLSVNATNLFDREYVASCSAATSCFWGNRRTVLATLRYRW